MSSFPFGVWIITYVFRYCTLGTYLSVRGGEGYEVKVPGQHR